MQTGGFHDGGAPSKSSHSPRCMQQSNFSTVFLCIIYTVFDLISEHALISGHLPFFVLKKNLLIFLICFNLILFYFNINNYFK